MNQIKKLMTPLTEESIKNLHAGDSVLLSGVIYTARDKAHKLLTETLVAGKALPVDLQNQLIYYVGPAPAKPGQPIGSCGPTTSSRMDSYAPMLCLLYTSKQTTAQSRWGQSAISQKAVDEIEEFFIAEGYAVLNSDSKYPSYLENAQRFYDFWDAVCRGDDIELEVLSVAQSGGLYYSLFRNEAGAETRVDVSVDWDEEREPFFSSVSYVEDEWTLTEYGNFYYKNVLTGVPYEDYELISLKPVDKTLYDLTEKYLAPIGYLSNNLLTCSWSREDYGTLSFNDLLEYLYRMEHNAFFSPEAYESVREPYSCYRIPAALFEETILPYFDINLAEFRQRSLYDAVTDSYPWQEICCENLTYYPTVEPEVVHCRDNADGTLTLTVRAKCNDYKAHKS